MELAIWGLASQRSEITHYLWIYGMKKSDEGYRSICPVIQSRPKKMRFFAGQSVAVLFISLLLPLMPAQGEEPDPEMDDAARLSPGSTEAEVRKVMGEPAKTNSFNGALEYYYGGSQVKFEKGKMVQWFPVDRLIPIYMADRKPGAAPIVIGSKTNEVLDAMGTPSGLTTFTELNQETWFYGVSSIVIVDGKVESWRDAWNLVVSPKTNNIGSNVAIDTQFEKEPTNDVVVLDASKPTVIYFHPGTGAKPQESASTPDASKAKPQPPGKGVQIKGYTRKNGTYVPPHIKNQ